MNRLLYLLIILLISTAINAQNSYYVKDSLISVGVEVKDGGAIQNAKQCQIELKKKTVIFSPDEVKEYGFKDGRIYLSRVIKIDNKEKKVFLEQLNKGKINFYYYKDKYGRKFFLEKDSGRLVEVLKKNDYNIDYREFLKTYVQDCDSISDALNLMTYNKPALSKFIKQYNNCEKKPFPFFKYGLTIGYSFSKPRIFKISDEILKNASFKLDKSLNIGAFMDIPILLSYFSLHPEFYYQKNAFSSHLVKENYIYDVIINTTSINIPVLIRYTYPSFKYRPYINLGGTFAYNIRNSNAIYTTTITNNIIEIEDVNKSNIYSETQIGYSVGFGIQYNIDNRKSLFFELRNNNLYSLTEETYGNKSIQCIIGINF